MWILQCCSYNLPRPQHCPFSRNSNIWLRESDGNSYNSKRVCKLVFAPHFNIWWGVNKFCRVLNEPPNGFGGEHPRVNRTTRNTSHSRRPETNEITTCGEWQTPEIKNAAGSRRNQRRKKANAPSNNNPYPLLAYSNAALEQAEGERLFFAAFFSRKESAFPCLLKATQHQKGRRRLSFLCSFLFSKRKRVPPAPLNDGSL